MTQRSKIWLGVGVLFTIGNLLGAGVAAAQGELVHASVHVGLLLLGAIVTWQLVPRSRRLEQSPPPRELSDRLTQLQQSVDAVAIEVERIGEGQRYITRFFTESGASSEAGAGAAEPIDIKAGEAPSRARINRAPQTD